MNILLKVSQQTLWQMVGKVITSLSTIIILGIVTRHFGESGTGIFTLALTYLAFFTLVIDFGVNAHLMPQLIKDNSEIIWRKLFGFRLGFAPILIPIAVLGGLFWPTQENVFKQLILIGSFMAILEPAIYVSVNAIFQSRFRYDLSVVGWSGAALITLFLVSLTTQLGFGLSWLMIDYSLGWLTGCLILLFFVKKFVKNIWPIFDLTFAKSLIKQAWPISATLILNVVYFRLDAFILFFYKSFAEVGIYNLAYQVFQAALVIPTFIMNGYFPLMLKSLQESKNKFISNLNLGFLVMTCLGLFVAVLTILFSPLIILVITGGKGFAGSIEVLRILSLSFPAFFASALLMWALVSLKKYKVMLSIYLVGLIFNVALNFVFIPLYSYTAAAWITVVSEYLILLLQTLFIYLYTPKQV